MSVSEMRPAWFNLTDIPFTKMWADDHIWFPYLLSNKRFYGYFTFKGMDTVVDYSLQEVSDISSISIPKSPLGKIDSKSQGDAQVNA